MVKQYLKYHTTNSETSMKQMLNQLIKDCYLIIYNITLLINKNATLYTANQKQQCKYSMSVSLIL